MQSPSVHISFITADVAFATSSVMDFKCSCQANNNRNSIQRKGRGDELDPRCFSESWIVYDAERYILDDVIFSKPDVSEPDVALRCVLLISKEQFPPLKSAALHQSPSQVRSIPASPRLNAPGPLSPAQDR